MMRRAMICAFVSMILPMTATTAQQSSFELVAGVVVDAGRDALYLMSPEGGVERISISSGNLVWTSQSAAKPLDLYGDLLIAQVEPFEAEAGLEIVLLDTLEGGAVRRQFRVGLPAGVRGTVDDGLGRSFAARAKILNGEPFVSWQFTERYTKGIAPGPGEALEQTRQAAYRLDLQASLLVPVESSAIAAVDVPLPAGVRAWMATETATEPPVRVGNVVATTQVVGDATSISGQLLLKRWDAGSGSALPDIELLRGPHILQLRSADDRHLLVTERVAPGDVEEYEWSVFSLETGERVGQLRHHQSHSRFFVAGRNIVAVERPYGRRIAGDWIEESRKLHAVVLGSGSTVWKRPLRDTAYRGPFPP